MLSNNAYHCYSNYNHLHIIYTAAAGHMPGTRLGAKEAANARPLVHSCHSFTPSTGWDVSSTDASRG
jgi:hypothetical protein